MERIYLSSPHMSGLEQPYVQDAFAANWIAPLGPIWMPLRPKYTRDALV